MEPMKLTENSLSTLVSHGKVLFSTLGKFYSGSKIIVSCPRSMQVVVIQVGTTYRTPNTFVHKYLIVQSRMTQMKIGNYYFIHVGKVDEIVNNSGNYFLSLILGFFLNCTSKAVSDYWRGFSHASVLPLEHQHVKILSYVSLYINYSRKDTNIDKPDPYKENMQICNSNLDYYLSIYRIYDVYRKQAKYFIKFM